MSGSLRLSTEIRLSRRDIFILGCTALISLVVYLVWSALIFRIGFPLDDSWIHQTYARNLALRGEWAFLPGKISAGSTAPLWTILLSVGFLLKLSPYFWTYLLGFLLLFCISLLAEDTSRRMLPLYHPAYPWVGCMFLLEWHLVWGAYSGMETILYIILVLGVMNILLTGSRKYILAGILTGVSIWVRPDGLTLLGPLLAVIYLTEKTTSIRCERLWQLVLGFGVLFFPYLLFNLIITGTPMPNTFYAKQAEYVDWQATPFWEKSLFFALQFFQGIAIILLPGFIQKFIGAVRQKDWRVLAVIIWVLGYCLLYVSRLPVYQHGRYLMPAMIIFLLIGFSGFMGQLNYFSFSKLKNRQIAILSLFIVVVMVSFIFGGYTYAYDVAYIESQMVDSARWVSENIARDEIIAAHDIGALGYFGQHSIVDLAGLISPEIVPIMTDDVRLSKYMTEHSVKYFIAFPGWRPALTVMGKQIFIIKNGRFLQAQEGNLAIYSWGFR